MSSFIINLSPRDLLGSGVSGRDRNVNSQYALRLYKYEYWLWARAWAVMEGNLKDIDGARALFREAVEIDPTNTVTIQAWAVAEARCGYASRARTLFQRAVAQDPGNNRLWQAWGRMELGRGLYSIHGWAQSAH
eukprot:scaffold76446_cov33-Prasinocladus_malaysianus.AAC.1